MNVIFLDRPLFDSVAMVNRSTGMIMVNAPKFAQYTPFEQRFILLHEEGHYTLQTDDEFTADAYAFDKLAGTEYKSLKQLIATLERVLPFTTPEHRERVNAQIHRALKWDYEHTGNKEAARLLTRISGEHSALEGVETKLIDEVAKDIANRNATSGISWFNKMSAQEKIVAAGAIVLGVIAVIIVTR